MEFYSSIILLEAASGRGGGDAIFARFGGTPFALPFERLAGRGVCKKCLQNLDGKELIGQNLENIGLRSVLFPAGSNASALTMMG